MFTLPVSTTELICSKLIVSVVWFLGTFAVDALGMLLSGMLGGYEDIVRKLSGLGADIRVVVTPEEEKAQASVG